MPIVNYSHTDWQPCHESFTGIPQSFYPQMSNIPFTITPTNVDLMQTEPLSVDSNSGTRPTQHAIQPRCHSNGNSIAPTGYFDVNQSFHTWQHDDVELDLKDLSYLPRHRGSPKHSGNPL